MGRITGKGIAALVAILLAVPAAHARADDGPGAVAATAVSVTGDVRLQTSQYPQSVEEGDVFTDGDRLVTGDGAALQLVLADGSSVALGPDSELTLDEAGSGAEGSVTLLTLARGLLDAIVQKLKLGSSFRIQTPYAVAAVKGTDFEVSEGAGGSGVTVNHGVVGFGDLGGLHSEDLNPMQRGLDDGRRLLPPRALTAMERRVFLRRWAGARVLHARRWALLRTLRRRPAYRRSLRRLLLRRAFRARSRRGMTGRGVRRRGPGARRGRRNRLPRHRRRP